MEPKGKSEQATRKPGILDWVIKNIGPNRQFKRKSRWMRADGVPVVKHGLRARTGKSGGTKVDRQDKKKRKIAQASRRLNRR